MNPFIIVQARMASTRLPGKVLMPVLGKPLLSYQLERLNQVKNARGIVVATTSGTLDIPIVALCSELDTFCYQGSENDVLDRYYQASLAVGAKSIVRITADCPLIDPALVQEVIDYFLENQPGVDYVSNGLVPTYPRGMDAEVFSMTTLEEAWKESSLPADREHVTSYIYRHPERYRLANVACSQELSHHRWTVDTPEDFELIRNMLQALYPWKRAFTLEDMVKLLQDHPKWAEINAGIKQKDFGE